MILIGLVVFDVSHINIYPPTPHDTIFLLEWLNLASYILSLCPFNLAPTEPFLQSHICIIVSGLADNNCWQSFEYCNDHIPYLYKILRIIYYLWSDNCINYFVFYKSHIFIVLSCDPLANCLFIVLPAKHYIEFKCAFIIDFEGDIWFIVKSCKSSY